MNEWWPVVVALLTIMTLASVLSILFRDLAARRDNRERAATSYRFAARKHDPVPPNGTYHASNTNMSCWPMSAGNRARARFRGGLK